ncbi:ArsR/SmtB family transcription factor [Nocardia sp. NPDC059240]|uniref:ArsR/SmtB family transcription factor n=1 Tax=Nocardia sp. NPDC059240 TaxID=3346786 RepID=UPI0036A18CB2
MEATLRALAEPNRRHIVELLRDGPRSVNEIVERLELKQQLVSKHLQSLREAGLVKMQPIAQRRVYALRAEPFRELDAWLETVRRVWEERLDEFDSYLQVMKDDHGRDTAS